jgi:hypothetical protein
MLTTRDKKVVGTSLITNFFQKELIDSITKEITGAL